MHDFRQTLLLSCIISRLSAYTIIRGRCVFMLAWITLLIQALKKAR